MAIKFQFICEIQAWHSCRASLYIMADLALYIFLRKPQSSTKSLKCQRKNATFYSHRTHKTPGMTSASIAVRRLALWAERYQKIVSPHPLRSCIILLQDCSPRSHKTQACNAPLIPTWEEWSPSLPQCGVDRQCFALPIKLHNFTPINRNLFLSKHIFFQIFCSFLIVCCLMVRNISET